MGRDRELGRACDSYLLREHERSKGGSYTCSLTEASRLRVVVSAWLCPLGPSLAGRDPSPSSPISGDGILHPLCPVETCPVHITQTICYCPALKPKQGLQCMEGPIACHVILLPICNACMHFHQCDRLRSTAQHFN